MSNINLKRFVDIDIQPRVTSNVSGVRDTIALFTPEGTANNVVTFSSLSSVTYATTSDTYKYLKIFFDNGGIKAEVHEGVSYSSLTKAMILALDNKRICIACVAPAASKQACYTAMKTLAVALNTDSTVYGINEKMLIACSESSDVDTASVKNFAAKYSTVLGGEMTIAAYLTRINTEGIDSIQDYAFTQETIDAEDITDTFYGTLQDNNMNVDIDLSGTVRNCGGNMKNGADIVNNYVRIILHQTLTTQLLGLLTQKIKSSTGVSKLYAVIAQELEKYKNCGYLTSDKVWLDNDLKVTVNNVTYTIVSKGEALVNGYVIKILPMTSLSDADKTAHKAPPIYVIIADQYSIRKITVNGEVI